MGPQQFEDHIGYVLQGQIKELQPQILSEGGTQGHTAGEASDCLGDTDSQGISTSLESTEV